jgi:predicted Fe-Mo cluster-binding NifX family protein
MKIWIPTIDDRGPEGLPSSHFGASPYFTFFDLDTGEWEAVRNPSGGQEHGACRPLDAVLGRPADALLCGGLGGGAFSRLQRAGLRVYLVREPTTGDCLEAFKEGRMRELTESEVCQGHGHGHAHGHGHGHGHAHSGGRGAGHGRGQAHSYGGGHGHGYSQGQGREEARRGETAAITPAEEGF